MTFNVRLTDKIIKIIKRLEKIVIIEKINVGIMHVNCYIVGDANEVFVIDPGGSAERILTYLDEHKYRVKYIILTHCHFDHILAVNEIKQKTGAKVVVCRNEIDNLSDNSINMTDKFRGNFRTVNADISVSETDILTSGDFIFNVIETPGHTSGSMCLYCENEKVLFSGDTLFCNSIGRTDFPTGDFASLMKSIKTKLLTLPGDVHVFPGHQMDTTIMYEVKNNPYLR